MSATPRHPHTTSPGSDLRPSGRSLVTSLLLHSDGRDGILSSSTKGRIHPKPGGLGLDPPRLERDHKSPDSSVRPPVAYSHKRGRRTDSVRSRNLVVSRRQTEVVNVSTESRRCDLRGTGVYEREGKLSPKSQTETS